MSLSDLKRHRDKAQERRNHLDRAITRLGNVKDWARKVGLKRLGNWLTDRIETLRDERTETIKVIRKLTEKIRNWSTDVPPVVDGGWHPGATRTQVQGGIGAFMNVPAKLVWHTTEGSSLPAYSGSHPHFTLNPQTGALYQHVPITSGCYALRNLSGGVETNRANSIQVELIGFASQTQNWSDAAYANVAKLARWIEKHGQVQRRCSVRFGGAGNLPARLSGSAWISYAGHIGHQHIPEQDHWDPGAFLIGKVL